MLNVTIIGGGCAGLSAAIYCARANLAPLVFMGDMDSRNGMLAKTSIVENYPGYPNGILGPDLVDNLEKQALNCGARILDQKVDKIIPISNGFTIISESQEYHTRTIILATGSTPNKLLLPNEDRLWSNGISSCAVCDGALYKGKKIVVVGGGDSAMEESSYLTKYSNVTLIHRRGEFRASQAMQKKVLENPRITVIYNSVVTELVGSDCLESIKIKNIVSGEESILKVDGLFYGLGLTPNSSLVKDLLELENGYVKRFGETATSIKGLFVAGDVGDPIYRQAIVAAGDGCKAALDVDKYLSH